MNADTQTRELISAEEYLEGERVSEIRHEYVIGHVYAMAGASDDHNRIAGNTLAELRSALRGKRCEAFLNDMKVKIPPVFAEAFYYPDVMVACDPSDNAGYYRERPTIIFEVLSPETERTDQREKAIAYSAIPSLTTYILAEQDRLALTVLRRAESGWRSEALQGPCAILKLPDIGVEIPLERIYERTAVLRVGVST
jgi:Uma2 family endonuclease